MAGWKSKPSLNSFYSVMNYGEAGIKPTRLRPHFSVLLLHPAVVVLHPAHLSTVLCP